MTHVYETKKNRCNQCHSYRDAVKVFLIRTLRADVPLNTSEQSTTVTQTRHKRTAAIIQDGRRNAKVVRPAERSEPMMGV